MNYKFLILIFFVTNLMLVGQEKYGQVDQKNSTGRFIRVYFTEYKPDSTKNSYVNFWGLGNSMKGPNTNYYGLIRMDIIAIDDSTKDTLYIKTFDSNELAKDPFIFHVTKSKDKLSKPFIVANRLMIKAKGTSYVYKINAIMAIKTSKGKYEGVLKSFDNNDLTLIDEKGNSIIVNKKELIGIKGCAPLIASGPYFSMFNHCSYDKLEDVRFKTVQQVYNHQKNNWAWQEIK